MFDWILLEISCKNIVRVRQYFAFFTSMASCKSTMLLDRSESSMLFTVCFVDLFLRSNAYPKQVHITIFSLLFVRFLERENHLVLRARLPFVAAVVAPATFRNGRTLVDRQLSFPGREEIRFGLAGWE